MKDEEEEVDAREGACSIETAMARSCWQGAGFGVVVVGGMRLYEQARGDWRQRLRSQVRV